MNSAKVLLVAFSVVASLICSSWAFAYEGEIHLDAQASIDAAALLNPRAGGLVPVGESASIGVRPHLLVGARYSITHAFYVGAGLEGMYNLSPSLSPFWTVSRTTYDNQPARTPSALWSLTLGEKDPALAGQFTGDLYALHGAASLLFTAGYRPHLGYNYMGVFEVAAGPAVGVWYSTGLTTPPESSPNGPALILTADQLLHQVVPGAALRIQGGFEARLFEHVEVAALPYVEASFVGTFAITAGIAFRGTYAISVVPL